MFLARPVPRIVSGIATVKTMPPDSGDRRGRFVLLDIEGTTTPLDFVHRILFPYAKKHLEPYIESEYGSADFRVPLEQLRHEYSKDLRRNSPPRWSEGSRQEDVASIARYLEWMMDLDRKSSSLKAIQGRIWQQGYRAGLLCGQVFPDVPIAFERWRQAGRTVGIYSSGSVLAQRLLFASTDAGNLTGFISKYFDTNIGSKRDSRSYLRIAETWDCKAAEILFISDAPDELSAATESGMQTLLCLRPGNVKAEAAGHQVITSFDGV